MLPILTTKFSRIGWKQDTKNPQVRILSTQLKRATPEETAEAIFGYVRDTIQYIPDEMNKDYWQTPVETINRQAGDCEDKSILLMSLLTLATIPNWLLIVKGNDWSQFHAIVIAQLPTMKKPILLDPSIPQPYNQLPEFFDTVEVYGVYGYHLTTPTLIPLLPLALPRLYNHFGWLSWEGKLSSKLLKRVV